MPTVNGTFFLISLKESRQALNCKSREQRYHDKGAGRGTIKFLARNRANAHRNERASDDQDDRELSNRGAPFAQPQFSIGIAATLEEASQTQSRKRGKDQREIAKIQHERLAAVRKTKINLD